MARWLRKAAQNTLIALWLLFTILPGLLMRETGPVLWWVAKNPCATCKQFLDFWKWDFWKWVSTYAIPEPWSYAVLRNVEALMGPVRRVYWKTYERSRSVRRDRLRQRRRALTQVGLRTPAQDGCTFLTKLPAEIRTMIYDMYFEHSKVLVVPIKHNFTIRDKTLTVIEGGPRNSPYLVDAQVRWLSLSLTCKQMQARPLCQSRPEIMLTDPGSYAETIHMMYASKTFCFSSSSMGFDFSTPAYDLPEGEPSATFTHLAHVMALHRQILPQRWDAITSIECDAMWRLHIPKTLCLAILPVGPSSLGQYGVGRYGMVARDHLWPHLWAIFNTMPGLERIVVANVNLGDELEHLVALLSIKKRMKVFDVHLPSFQNMSRLNEFKTELDKANVRFLLRDGQTFTDEYIDVRGRLKYCR